VTAGLRDQLTKLLLLHSPPLRIDSGGAFSAVAVAGTVAVAYVAVVLAMIHFF